MPTHCSVRAVNLADLADCSVRKFGGLAVIGNSAKFKTPPIFLAVIRGTLSIKIGRAD